MWIIISVYGKSLVSIFSGVPQGSILGLLMSNIYISGIFLFPDNVCLSNYADDTNLYTIGENHNTNRNILNKYFLSLQAWFYNNYMVLNPGKCCYMSFGSNPAKVIWFSKVAPKSFQEKNMLSGELR